jgi:hypothetical protein
MSDLPLATEISASPFETEISASATEISASATEISAPATEISAPATHLQPIYDVVSFANYPTPLRGVNFKWVDCIARVTNSEREAFLYIVTDKKNARKYNGSARVTNTIIINKNELQSHGTKLIYELPLNKLYDYYKPDIIFNITSNVETTFVSTCGFTNEIDITLDLAIPIVALCYSVNKLIFYFDNFDNFDKFEINLTYTIMYLDTDERRAFGQNINFVAIEKNCEYFANAGAVTSLTKQRNEEREQERLQETLQEQLQIKCERQKQHELVKKIKGFMWF